MPQKGTKIRSSGMFNNVFVNWNVDFWTCLLSAATHHMKEVVKKEVIIRSMQETVIIYVPVFMVNIPEQPVGSHSWV